jgi:hypothetical protein
VLMARRRRSDVLRRGRQLPVSVLVADEPGAVLS